MEIKEALAQLDPENDAQWTNYGLPLVDVMRTLTGNEELTRQLITEAEPEFNREAARAARPVQEEVEAEAEVEAPAKPQPQLAVLDGEIQDLLKEKNELDKKIVALSRKRDAVQEREFRTRTPEDNIRSIQTYIKSQAQARMDRATNRQRFIESGLTSRDLDPRAPIDQAMARKTQRGTQRPAR